MAWSLATRTPAPVDGGGVPSLVILTQQNVAALNVLRALVKIGLTDVKLVVSRDFYFEWHEHEARGPRGQRLVMDFSLFV